MSPTPNIGFNINKAEEKSIKTRITMNSPIVQSPKENEEEIQNLNFFVDNVKKEKPKPLIVKNNTSG